MVQASHDKYNIRKIKEKKRKRKLLVFKCPITSGSIWIGVFFYSPPLVAYVLF